MERMGPFRTTTPKPGIDLERKDGHGPGLDTSTVVLLRKDLIQHKGKQLGILATSIHKCRSVCI